jgi:hypothetical protein
MTDPLTHWITTHYPHGPNDRWYVYLQSKQRKDGIPQRGNKVLFYETALKNGEGALVCAAEVCGEVRDRVPPAGDGFTKFRATSRLSGRV